MVISSLIMPALKMLIQHSVVPQEQKPSYWHKLVTFLVGILSFFIALFLGVGAYRVSAEKFGDEAAPLYAAGCLGIICIALLIIHTISEKCTRRAYLKNHPVEAKVSQLKNDASEFMHNAPSIIDHYKEEGMHYIQKNPLHAAIFCFVAGLVLVTSMRNKTDPRA